VITILPGGVIRKITPGGGNSTLITICGGIAWAAQDGDLFGPAVLVCLTPLPVELIRWQAFPSETYIDLVWSTATEINNDHFEIERSVNGIDYHQLADVPGAGTSALQHDYRWSDHAPASGLNYYRLIQVDMDGQRTEYDPVAVKWSSRAFLHVYPNPATEGRLSFVYNGVSQQARILVTDSYGRSIYTMDETLREGTHTVEAALQAGLYFLTVETATTRYTEMVQVGSGAGH
jgi:hypothetical protein